MSDRDGAYEHDAGNTGSHPGRESADSTEHRDTAHGNSQDRNELTPDERGRTDGYGPRTHDDTRVTRKDGA